MKQYFSYFKWIFIALGALMAITIFVAVARAIIPGEIYVRKNTEAPEERVFDYADVLTNSEERDLEELIAKREKQIGCDIVLVTIDESLYDIYGITEDTDYNWEWSITEYAESFFIDNGFGYNVAGQNGDGALLLHNWHPIEKGLHVTHGGRVWNHYSDSMISDLLDDIYYKAKIDPYEAYKYYIENMYREMSGQANKINLPPFILFIIAIVAATIFIATHMKSKEGSKTTTASTYGENGSVQFKVRTDQLVNKYVTSRVIQTSSSSGGSRSGGGRSSGGSRMGGGSRRG